MAEAHIRGDWEDFLGNLATTAVPTNSLKALERRGRVTHGEGGDGRDPDRVPLSDVTIRRASDLISFKHALRGVLGSNWEGERIGSSQSTDSSGRHCAPRTGALRARSGNRSLRRRTDPCGHWPLPWPALNLHHGDSLLKSRRRSPSFQASRLNAFPWRKAGELNSSRGLTARPAKLDHGGLPGFRIPRNGTGVVDDFHPVRNHLDQEVLRLPVWIEASPLRLPPGGFLLRIVHKACFPVDCYVADVIY